MCALVAVGGRTHGDRRGSAVAVAAHTSPSAGAFRLGTAARPFAWSTAVGDLNADGRPDVAVADRVGRGGSGFAYNVQLSISGGPSQSVDFDSDQDALSVALRDVDHDRDLDVVVTGTVSRSVVAIWLNDGTGRFARATLSPQALDWRAAAPDLTRSDGAGIGVGEVIPRTGGTGVASERAGSEIPLPVFSLVTCGAFRTARASLAGLRPRAPPTVTT